MTAAVSNSMGSLHAAVNVTHGFPFAPLQELQLRDMAMTATGSVHRKRFSEKSGPDNKESSSWLAGNRFRLEKFEGLINMV